MTLTFKYILPSDGFSSKGKKPMVELTSKGNGESPLKIIALLDSGADISVIPKDLAEFFSLKKGKKSESKGIGGTIIVWDSIMPIKIGNGHETYNFKIPIQIADDLTIPPIIGRRGFFDKFEIIFDEEKQKIKLKRNQKKFY